MTSRHGRLVEALRELHRVAAELDFDELRAAVDACDKIIEEQRVRRKAGRQSWKDRNRDHNREYCRQWRLRNQDRVRNYEENERSIRERSLRYRTNHREVIKVARGLGISIPQARELLRREQLSQLIIEAPVADRDRDAATGERT